MSNPDPSACGHLQVLLVEDNPSDVRLMQEAFKESGMPGHLNVVRDGEQAMAFLRREGEYRYSPRPSFILLDLNLPRKDGREVLAEIKREAKLCQIPVLVLSTSTRPEDVAQVYSLHANCYIAKPLDLAKLLLLAEQLKAFWFCTVILAPPLPGS